MNSSSREMPPHWDDDTKMSAMFAPFRVKSLNPIGWEFKMRFWTDAVRQYCDSTMNPSLALNDLTAAFRRKNKHPDCLDTVVRHMAENNMIVPKNRAFQKDAWLSWSTLLKPVSWATKSLVPNFFTCKESDVESAIFVHLESLKKLSLLYISSIPEKSRIGTFSTLRAASSLKSSTTDETVQLLLEYLVHEKLAVYSEKNQLYKLTTNTNAKASPLTIAEISLFKINQTIDKLEESMTDLNSKISSSLSATKEHLRRGNKMAAKHQLKQKKAHELRLEKLINNHNTLTNLSENIKQTHLDAEVFDVFKNSMSALKTTMKDNNLEENIVLDTMDDIKDTLDEISNIQTAVSQPIGMQFDESDLELELEELTKGTSDAGNAGGGSISMDDLPQVPKNELEEATEALRKKLVIAEDI